MAIGRGSGRKVDRAGMARFCGDAAIIGATVLMASQARSDPLNIAESVQVRGAAPMKANRAGELER
jgi:hypothetical protein